MNNTQQIIKQAKELGYIPEKKISKSQIPDYRDGSVSRACDERDIPKLVYIWQNQLTDLYNKAIDSFNLEKIIELAYERVGEEINRKVKEYHKDCLTDMFINGKFWAYKEMQEYLLSNLSNKED